MGNLEDIVKGIIAGSLAVDPDEFSMEVDISAMYNADSLDIMTLIKEIELEFDYEIEDKYLPELKTGYDILNHLKSHL